MKRGVDVKMRVENANTVAGTYAAQPCHAMQYHEGEQETMVVER